MEDNIDIPRTGKWVVVTARMDSGRIEMIDKLIAYKIEIGDYFGQARGEKQRAVDYALTHGFAAMVSDFFDIDIEIYNKIKKQAVTA